MRCPKLKDLPIPEKNKKGWPWTKENQPLPNLMTNGKQWPQVSIVMPSFNQARFIEEAIRSVLLQGYPNLELIIIDGGSTDGTVKIIRKYKKWLVYWISEKDKGQSHAINKGLKKSSGKFFNWQNSDDMLTPNSLAKTVKAMVEHPEASYVHGYYIVIDDKSRVQRDTKKCYGSRTAFLPRPEIAFSLLTAGAQVGCLMDKDLVVKAGMIDQKLHYIMDVDILLRLIILKPALYIPYPLAYARVYPGIKSFQWNDKRAKERLLVASKIFSRQDLPLAIKELKWRAFASAHRFARQCYTRAGQLHLALYHLAQEIFYRGRAKL